MPARKSGRIDKVQTVAGLDLKPLAWQLLQTTQNTKRTWRSCSLRLEILSSCSAALAASAILAVSVSELRSCFDAGVGAAPDTARASHSILTSRAFSSWSARMSPRVSVLINACRVTKTGVNCYELLFAG